MNKVFIISGKSGHGKDQVATYIKEILERRYKKVLVIHFADVLKYFLREFYGYDGDKSKPENRTLLQHVGTDMVRKKHANYWVGIVLGFLSAQEDYDDFDYAIVPDARFENEVDLLMDNLKYTVGIRVNRFNEDGTPWENPKLTEEQKAHPSETALDNRTFEYTIFNDGDLELLHDNCEVLLHDLHII